MSREKRYQVLSRFSVLIATESWAGPGNEASIGSNKQMEAREWGEAWKRRLQVQGMMHISCLKLLRVVGEHGY